MYDDVKKNWQNLCTAWLDYKKAFDNVSHSWIIESLQLAKIPQKIIGAISDLMHKWRTKVYLYGETSSIETNFINYLRGILQGDTLSLLLFALSVNPLSYLLSKEDGFKLAVGKLKQNLSHLLFVDDLKLFTTTRDKLLKLLGIVTQFSNDIGMVFGESKCAYQCIERGKLVIWTTPIEINGLTIQETKQGDHYRYLGMDETIGIDNVMNKGNAVKEYKNRLKKIWSSELNGMNKTTTHNTFAVPVISYTVGILDWTKKEIQDLDITIRKYLAMNRSFHKASDINRLYTERKRGARGLLNLEDMYENRNIFEQNDFDFHIVNFPYLSSNIPSGPSYGVYISQLIRYARCCSHYDDFRYRHKCLVDRLLSQGYIALRLEKSFKKFYGRYQDLIEKYQRSVNVMVNDSFPG